MAMFPKILLALDGSMTAEAAIPYLTSLVRTDPPEEIVLLNVADSNTEMEVQAAKAYLQTVANDLEAIWRKDEIPVPLLYTTVLTIGEPGETDSQGRPRRISRREIADAIIRAARDSRVDLICMTTNGWMGSDKWLLGLVAENVLQKTECSVFLVHSDDYHPVTAPPRIDRILVPLDGSELAEQVLPIAEKIARQERSELMRLVYVLPPSEGAASRTVRPVLDFRPFPRGDVRHYLSSKAENIEARGVPAEAGIRQGDPGREIKADAVENGMSLIVLASNGRTGFSVKPYGKVADEVIHGTPVPVLFIRPKNVPVMALP